MYTLIAILQGISCLIGFIIGILLLFENKNKGINTILLSLLMLLFSFHTLSLIFYYSKWILNFPLLHRTTAPLTLIAYPVAYLYVRNNVNNISKLYKWDWLWLIPSIVFFLFFSPYYILPSDLKQHQIEAMYTKNGLIETQMEGIFPKFIFSFFRMSLFFITLYCSHLEIKKAIIENKIPQATIKWLKFLVLWLSILVLIALPSIIISTIWNTNHFIADITVSLTCIFISVYLFKKPEILYGTDFENPQIKQLKNKLITQINGQTDIKNGLEDSILSATSATQTIPNENERIKKKIESYFTTHNPYLNPEFSLDDLVKAISIPRYLISAVINKNYGISFRELVNLYRINYLLKNKEKPEWSNLTWEAIAEESGFKSRFTFIKNFKQVTGMTPSEYSRIIKK